MDKVATVNRMDQWTPRGLQKVGMSWLRVDPGPRRTPASLSRAAAEVILLSRFYYIFIVFSIGTSILPFDRAYMRGPPTAAIWPIDVLERLTGTGWLASTIWVSAAGLTLALLAAVFPRIVMWRLGVFLYLLLFIALRSSYGSIDHGNYFYLYVSFALLFLPPRDKPTAIGRRDTLSCLAVLWLIQTIMLLPYSLSGWWKIWDGRLELVSSDSMVRILLDRAMDDTDNIAPLLPFISQHELLAQSLLLATVYIELFALLAVFRPHLQRVFGVVLIIFHVGSDWIMNISFFSNFLMIGLFLVLSPTAPARFSLSGLLQSLPVFGIPFRAWVRLRSSRDRDPVARAWLVYDGECPLCRNYTQYLRVKERVRELVLVDAREGGPLVDEVRELPHDLNDGMVLKMHGRYYIGHEALNVLALVSEKRGGFSRLNRLVFSSPLAARLGYPLLKAGRRLLLRIKGVPPIPE